MATQLQLRRGTTSENGSFTGALGEVTVDTDKDTLVVHDGATAGGHEMAKKDGSNMTAIDVGDNVQLKMGNSDDLKIYHDGNNSIIADEGTGNLNIRGANTYLQNADGTANYLVAISGDETKLYFNNSAKIATTSTGVAVTGDITASGHIDVGDSVQLKMGNSDDLKIYHDGSNSFVTDEGTGDLILRGANVRLSEQSSNENFVYCSSNGAVTLYYDNAQKIATTTSGVDVTGTATMDGLTIDSGTASPFITLTRSGTYSGTSFHQTVSNITGAGADLATYSTDNNTGFYWQTTNGSGTTATALVLDPDQNVSIPNGEVRIGANEANVFDNSSGNGVQFKPTGEMQVAGTSSEVLYLNRMGTDGRAVNIRKSGAFVGGIDVTSSAVSYNTSSDYRLKEDVQPMSGATDRLKELKPVNFAWKSDGSRVDGFLAHEAQEVVPESVTGTKDAMMTEEYEVSPATGDIYTPAVEAVEGVEAVEYVAPQDEVLDEDGNVVTEAVAEVMAVEAVEAVEGVAEVIHSADAEQPSELEDGQEWRETTAQVMGEREVPDYQGIDQAKLVPLLVATIQELEARITALEA